MHGTLLRPQATRWVCDLCSGTSRTTEPRVHSRMHSCPALGGLTAPMRVDDGRPAKTVVTEREDYIGDETVQRDGNGRPVMNVMIESDAGQHLAVYAPTAVGRVG